MPSSKIVKKVANKSHQLSEGAPVKKRKKIVVVPPQWKGNPDYSHLPLFDIPHNYLRVTSEKDCPPGIFGWVTCENDKVFLVIRQLRYEFDKEIQKIKVNPVTNKGYPVNTWNGIKIPIKQATRLNRVVSQLLENEGMVPLDPGATDDELEDDDDDEEEGMSPDGNDDNDD